MKIIVCILGLLSLELLFDTILLQLGYLDLLALSYAARRADGGVSLFSSTTLLTPLTFSSQETGVSFKAAAIASGVAPIATQAPHEPLSSYVVGKIIPLNWLTMTN